MGKNPCVAVTEELEDRQRQHNQMFCAEANTSSRCRDDIKEKRHCIHENDTSCSNQFVLSALRTLSLRKCELVVPKSSLNDHRWTTLGES